MTYEESAPVPIEAEEPPLLLQPGYPAQPMETEERLTPAEKAADFILQVEPVWVTIAVAVVFAMIQTGGSYPWIPLVLAAVPFPLRWWRLGHISKRTSFDIPIAIFLVAAVVGTIVSDDLALSLGAFQSCLAAALLYYSLVNYPHPKRMLIGVLAVTCLAASILCVWGFAAGFTPESGTNSISSWASDLFGSSGEVSPAEVRVLDPLVHGMLVVFAIVFCVLLGVAIFAKRNLVRLAVVIPCLLIILFGVLSMGEATSGLGDGTTIEGRMTHWEEIGPLLNEDPFTGVGLGNYPLLSPVSWSTHAHNSYLELYANYGILGIMAGVFVLLLVIKLGWELLRASRGNPWYGFGVGVLLAILAVAVIGLVESAPMGMPATGTDGFHYVVSPVPWILGAVLIAVHQLVTKRDSAQEVAKDRFLEAEEIDRLLS